ncbi:MAG: PVC-type heme-binding CxxCH protein [Cyclobacteriaceae bacterium]
MKNDAWVLIHPCSPVIRSMFSFRPILLFAQEIMLMSCMCSCHSERTSERVIEQPPRLLDERLTLSLFAADPDIVTPIGIVADSLDRIYVLESHTHQPPKDYRGPGSDRIKIFIDANKDGTAEKTSVFAEGFHEGVNMAFSPEGDLYVVTSRAVYRLYDRDGDAISEEREIVVQLSEPKKVYAHAALLGITFSEDGWLYISRGNTGSAHWKITGSDSSFVMGYGDGGNVVRARLNGSSVEEVATGFWNPVDLKFDDYGRLMVADNDPDSRGPNRLVHVVPGGDYGYKSLYGGSGIHPYLAWNGELPGTLPFAVALGEAPSGLLNGSLTSLPEDYHGQMLASIWEEGRIVRINFKQRGISVTGDASVLLEGGTDFRPVAFASGPHGDVYFTDWVLRNYPNHGRGRIWKLAAKRESRSSPSRKEYDKPLTNPTGEPLRMIHGSWNPVGAERRKEALRSDDPFIRHAAIVALSSCLAGPEREKAIMDQDPNVRLGGMLAMQRTGYTIPKESMMKLLIDPDERVRRQALIWIGSDAMRDMLPFLERSLAAGPPSPTLFETYLETIRHLQPAFMEAYRNHSKPYANAIDRPLPAGFLENFIRDETRHPGLRAVAIAHLEKPENHVSLLMQLLQEGNHPELAREAVHALAYVNKPEVAAQLLKLAEDASNDVSIRAESLLSLMWQGENLSREVKPLLDDTSADIRLEAARYIRTKLPARQARKTFQDAALPKEDDAVKEQAALIGTDPGVSSEGRPSSPEQWQRAVSTGGDSNRGRRAFYSPLSFCSSCHAIQGKGGDLGPDLSKVALSKSRTQLLTSIIDPTAEISPEYQGWYIQLIGGERHEGRQIDIGEKDIELYTHTKEFRSFSKNEIADYGMVTTSLMPEDLVDNLTVSDVRDILAFLEAQSLVISH